MLVHLRLTVPTPLTPEPTEPRTPPHALRPGRADSARSLPPGPRASRENVSPESSEAVISISETPAEAGDSRPGETAPNAAGPADSEGEDPRSGDTAEGGGTGETSSGSVRQQGRERGREAGPDAPADSGEEKSS